MPADVVVLEGILVLHMEEIRSLLNMKVYVDTDDDVRLARRCGWHGIACLPACLPVGQGCQGHALLRR